MTTNAQSKAQRRTESQRKAAERKAAELRARRRRTAVRYGGGAAIMIAIVVVIVILATSGKSNAPAPTVANLKTEAIPASLHMVADPKSNAGPEGINTPIGPKLATLVTATTGQTVDGVQCQAGEQLVSHVHTHLTIFVNGKARVIPYGIGIPGEEAVATPHGAFVETGSCFYWLHTHAIDGIIHVESPSASLHFTLGQFFAEWGQTLSRTQVGPASGKLTVFFTSPGKPARLYTGNPADLPLGDHYQIQIDVGTPIVKPVDVTDWHDL